MKRHSLANWPASRQIRLLAAAEQAWAIPKRQEIMPGQALEPVKKGVTMDGVLVYILDEEELEDLEEEL